MSAGLLLRLRPTMASDLDFVQSVEDDAANRPFITPWERVQHEGAIRFPDFRHFIPLFQSSLPKSPNPPAFPKTLPLLSP